MLEPAAKSCLANTILHLVQVQGHPMLAVAVALTVVSEHALIVVAIILWITKFILVLPRVVQVPARYHLTLPLKILRRRES